MNIIQLIDEYNAGKDFKFIFFWGWEKTDEITKTCLSNWYMADFIENDIKYNCVEQYMMAKKALLFNDNETYDLIMKETDPRVIKDLGRKVRNFDKKIWKKHDEKIVEQGAYLKFSQNYKLKDYLLSTKDAVLVEASPLDDIWGIKKGEIEPDIYNPNNWNGLNKLGFSIMRARERIQNGE